MLVLSRHKDESIMIGDKIELVVINIGLDRVRLGIDAPPDYAISRPDVDEALKRKQIKQRFNEYLNSGNYLEAYNLIEIGEISPTVQRLSELTKGLVGKL